MIVRSSYAAATRGFAATAGMALALMGAASVTHASRAATAPPAALSTTSAMGSVDVQKVLSGYTKKADQEQKFQGEVDQYNTVFTTQKNYPMLSQSEQAQLGALLLKEAKTPADEAQIAALEKHSADDTSELTALQQKANMTDVDRARLTALNQEQQAGQTGLQAQADSYKQQLDAKNQAAADAITSDIKAAVAQVAAQRGLVVVFDSSVAIYAANDITQLVITRLNSGK